METQWREIAGFGGNYAVSDKGEVIRLRAATNAVIGQKLKPHRHKQGYLHYALSCGGRVSMKLGHRLVLESFSLQVPQNKPQVNHKNGIKADNRLENLEWVNNSENVLHSMHVLGNKQRSGEGHYKAKLKESDVMRIWKMRLEWKMKISEIAKCFGVSVGNIGFIFRHKNWRGSYERYLKQPDGPDEA